MSPLNYRMTTICEFATAVTAQTLRFNLMDTTGGNTGAVDIAVYGNFIDE